MCRFRHPRSLFRDHADPAPRSRRVFFFHRPETLRRWLDAPMTLRGHLQAMPPLLTERLRECRVVPRPRLSRADKLKAWRCCPLRIGGRRLSGFRAHNEAAAEHRECGFELFEADGVVAVEDMSDLLRGQPSCWASCAASSPAWRIAR
jgi:hypothetical protein